ncbi:MAG TPA: ABC-F family ATP-binding cassette domain-containing protein [Patescibacteria group bacterium]|nr:ABC-F family ATP-binding cassette domain-containing protein [Patescibacteria group bacterium]
MIELALRNLEKYYGAHHLLQGVTLEVQTGDRIALLGANGAGKSTLFQIVAGHSAFDAGERMLRKGAVIGLLEQIPGAPPGLNARQVLGSAYGELLAIKEQMNQLEEGMADPAGLEMKLEQYGRLQQRFETGRGYDMEENLHRVCTGLDLGPTLLSTAFTALSGGEKSRVMLGKLLLQKPDLLLLDEPTNHLDVKALEWLEEFLCQYPGTVIVISHDRYFLNQVATRVLELEESIIQTYEGNYSYYLAEKEARRVRRQEKFNEEQKNIRRMESAARRMHDWAQRADNPGMHKRAFQMEKRIARLQKTPPPPRERRINTSFQEERFSGQEVLLAQQLFVSFSGQPVLCGLSCTLHKRERVALLGANGAGKSTLMKTLAGEIQPDQGVCRLGPSIRFAYLPQTVTFECPAASVLDTVRQELEMGETEARSLLARYLFHGEAVHRSSGNLSGGEKSRLRLCLLMQRDMNLLLLDEPTNHLDIPSREWLEESLSQFSGAILFVSHDRYFISRFATKIWELNKGKLTEHVYGYDEYRLKQHSAPVPPVFPAAVPPPSSPAHERASNKKHNPPEGRIPGAAIEEAILELETALAVLEKQMALCGSDFAALHPLLQQKEEWEQQREALYQRWIFK